MCVTVVCVTQPFTIMVNLIESLQFVSQAAEEVGYDPLKEGRVHVPIADLVSVNQGIYILFISLFQTQFRCAKMWIAMKLVNPARLPLSI